MVKWRQLSDEDGQGATEYLLVIAVVLIGTVSAAYTFAPALQSGVQALGENVERMLSGEPVSIAGDLLNSQAHDDRSPYADALQDDDLILPIDLERARTRPTLEMLAEREPAVPKLCRRDGGDC